jgi:vancomycin resistance protein VanJ
VLAWLLLFGSPAAGDRLHRLVWAGSLAYLVAAAGAAALLWGLGDRWWPATVLLFGPRWTLLLPIAILLPAALRWDRLMLFPLVLATWLVVVPVMGFVSGWRAWLATGWDTAPELGVVTFNARGGDGLRLTAAGMLREWRADIAGFQECGGVLRRELLALSDEDGWHTDARASLCLASRFPIVAVEEMEREAFEFAGGSALVVTWTMALNERDVVHVTNLHLETPRAGLGRIRRGRLGSGARLVTERSYLRALELERARRWTLHFAGPHLVLGDFNTPVESAAYREAWGDWQQRLLACRRRPRRHPPERVDPCPHRPRSGRRELAPGRRLDGRRPGLGPPAHEGGRPARVALSTARGRPPRPSCGISVEFRKGISLHGASSSTRLTAPLGHTHVQGGPSGRPVTFRGIP